MIGIYLVANLAYFTVLSGAEVGASERVAADMMRKYCPEARAGAARAALVSVAAMISIFAALNGSLLSGSRVPFAMARNGYFFHAVGRVHPRFRTPSVEYCCCWACGRRCCY